MTLPTSYIKALSLPAFVYALLGALVVGSSMVNQKYFSEAATLDLVITAPLIYLIASRKFKTRWMLVFPLMGVGFVFANFLFPKTNVNLFLRKEFLPLLELTSLATISWYFIRFYKEAKMNSNADAYTVIKKSVNVLFGSTLLSRMVAAEFAVFYYAFIAWRKENEAFTSYKNSNTLTVYGFLLFIVLAETFAMHFLWMKVNVIVAVVMLISSVYLALQLFAHAKALRLRTTEISDSLKIRYGLMGDVEISFDQIKCASICLAYKTTPSKRVVQIGLLKMIEAYTVSIELHESTHIELAYGLRRHANVILIPIDDPQRFISSLNSAMEAHHRSH